MAHFTIVTTRIKDNNSVDNRYIIVYSSVSFNHPLITYGSDISDKYTGTLLNRFEYLQSQVTSRFRNV